MLSTPGLSGPRIIKHRHPCKLYFQNTFCFNTTKCLNTSMLNFHHTCTSHVRDEPIPHKFLPISIQHPCLKNTLYYLSTFFKQTIFSLQLNAEKLDTISKYSQLISHIPHTCRSVLPPQKQIVFA